MKFLTLLYFQAFVIALLCSSAFTAERAATLDEVIKALGSLYQQKLFSFRDEADDFENSGERIVGGEPVEPVQDALETVTVPRYHYCMKSIPYCVTFYGSVIVQDKFDKPEKPEKPEKPKKLRQSGPQKKNIRNAKDQLCLRDIELGPCPDSALVGEYEEVIDIQYLDVHDFCFPGVITLGGRLDVLRPISQNATVHVQMIPTKLPNPVSKFNEPAACSQTGYFYNVCDLLERNISCPMPRNYQDMDPFPCLCPIDSGIYDMQSFMQNVDKVDFYGSGIRSGFAVISTEYGRSCFSFNFTGTFGRF